MKIKRRIVESTLIKEDEDALQKQLNKVPEHEGENINIADASKVEIAADIQQKAEDNDKAISAENALDLANDIIQTAENFNGKNLTLCSEPIGVRDCMLDSLVTALDEKEVGMDADYPNILISGLAGFGKTAIVKKFCQDYGLNLFKCDAKTLDTATVGGIPYPDRDPQTGALMQTPIASRYWDQLSRPNTILFLDELNRARPDIRGSLLTLVNEHDLPVTIKDEKTGEYQTTRHFGNILYTVACVNPAGDIFEDAYQLGPQEVSRYMSVAQEGSIKEFLGYINEIYTAILSKPIIQSSDRLRNKYTNQFEIAKTILTYPGFQFDDIEKVRQIYQRTGRHMTIDNYLNYRTFMLVLLRAKDKASFLKNAEHYSGLDDADIAVFKNALANYSDKQTKGNGIWNQGAAATQKSVKAEHEIDDILKDFAKALYN